MVTRSKLVKQNWFLCFDETIYLVDKGNCIVIMYVKLCWVYESAVHCILSLKMNAMQYQYSMFEQHWEEANWQTPKSQTGDQERFMEIRAICLIRSCDNLICDLNEQKSLLVTAGQKTATKTVTQSDQTCFDSKGLLNLGKVEAVSRSRWGNLSLADGINESETSTILEEIWWNELFFDSKGIKGLSWIQKQLSEALQDTRPSWSGSPWISLKLLKQQKIFSSPVHFQPGLWIGHWWLHLTAYKLSYSTNGSWVV